MEFKAIKTGDNFEMEFNVTDEKVMGFADVSGDNNPVHVDDEFAKNTRFGKRIAHGMLITSFISKVLGRDFPGDGTIYISQEVRFKRPVFIGDIVTVKVEVLEKKEEKNRLILATDVFNKEGKKVIEGKAEVLKS
jgi:3-hydroxybutyryl-CoA dehydratase